MLAAAIILSLAAAGGLVVASFPLRGIDRPPTWLALGHGVVAATGVGILIYAAATQPLPQLALVSLGMFVLAGVGGITMFAGFHLREKPLPKLLVIGHGILAVASLVVLWVATLRQNEGEGETRDGASFQAASLSVADNAGRSAGSSLDE